MRYFTPEFLPWDEEFTIAIDREVYNAIGKTNGSFSVLYARILGLSYANMLRYLEDYYDAKVTGKDGIYCVIRFPSEKQCLRVCDLLSSRWTRLLGKINAI
ncbi:MAG: hypothetical protein II453_14725 [Alphaproteobacteria bacterium]|nr:hypothetical protein [Alphaproteobacteria bacterium]